MKRKNRFAYVKKATNISTPASKSQSLIGSTSIKLYQDCRVPLDIFLECLFDKDYERLAIKGNPTDEQFRVSWEKIYVEFSELLDDSTGNDLFQKTIEINYLSGKLFLVHKIIHHLMLSYNEDDVEILRYYGVDYGITEADTYRQRCDKLQQVTNRIRTWEVDIQGLHNQFSELQQETSTAKGGRDFFEDSLLSISSFKKYAVLDKDISVRQFIKSLRQLEQFAIRLATQ